MKVGVYEAKSKLSKMIEKALAGEEVVITRNGKEAVKLIPVRESTNWIGMYEGQIKIHDSFYDPMTDEELAEFYGDDE